MVMMMIALFTFIPECFLCGGLSSGIALLAPNIQVYLTDMALFPAYSAVFNAYFDASTGPTCTTVAVKALAHPHQLIEIKAMAVAATGSVAAASAGAAPASFAVDV